jgi:hypothetical protein
MVHRRVRGMAGGRERGAGLGARAEERAWRPRWRRGCRAETWSSAQRAGSGRGAARRRHAPLRRRPHEHASPAQTLRRCARRSACPAGTRCFGTPPRAAAPGLRFLLMAPSLCLAAPVACSTHPITTGAWRTAEATRNCPCCLQLRQPLQCNPDGCAFMQRPDTAHGPSVHKSTCMLSVHTLSWNRGGYWQARSALPCIAIKGLICSCGLAGEGNVLLDAS